MTENTSITLNLQSPNISSVVYAVQNDRLSRKINVQLLDGASEWTPPNNTFASIRYLKPDGTGGFYDTDEAGNSAIVISGSTATLTLAEQALTVPGDVYMQLNFYNNSGERLTTFSWLLRVQKNVLSDAVIESSNYFNTLTEKIAQGIEVAEQLTYPVPISNGGTGANSVSGALANLGIANLQFKSAVVPNGETYTYSFGNFSHGVMFITGPILGGNGAYLLHTISSGSFVIINIVEGSGLTVSGSDGTLSVSNSSGYTSYILIFYWTGLRE